MPSLTLYHQSHHRNPEFIFSTSSSSQNENKVEKDMWCFFHEKLSQALVSRFGINIRQALYTYKTTNSFAFENFGKHTYKIHTEASHRAFYAPDIQDVVFNLQLGKGHLLHILENEISQESFGQASLSMFIENIDDIANNVNHCISDAESYIELAKLIDFYTEKDHMFLGLEDIAKNHITNTLNSIENYVDNIIEIKDISDFDKISYEEIFIIGDNIKAFFHPLNHSINT